MSESLLQLSDAERQGLTVCYLAPFAPEPGTAKPEWHPTVGVRAVYHYEIYTLLTGLGIEVLSCRDLDSFPACAQRSNYVFSLFSRAPFRNCEVYVPAVCERLRIPYLGAPPNIRALAEDKALAKLAAAAAGLPVVPGLACARAEDITAEAPFAGPYFVKYRFGSASEDVSLDCVQEEWGGAVAVARRFLEAGKECLIERLVPGIDITVPVLGGPQPLVLPPVAEISDLPYGIATFQQKRFLTGDRRRTLLEDAAAVAAAESFARALAGWSQPFDYMRVDFRWTPGAALPQFLEFNIACNLGSTAAICFSAASRGLTQAACIEHILVHSLRRQSALARPWQTVNI